MKKTVIVLMTVTMLVVLSMNPYASEEDTAAKIAALEKENKELKARISNLEGALSEIKTMLEEEKPTPETKAKEKPSIRCKYDADLYGYIKLDASYDTAQTVEGNLNLYVLSEGTNENDNQFNLTVRQTRLGLSLHGPDWGEAKTNGRIEVDFYEGGAENKNRIRLRHAYLTLDWPEKDLSLLAGQMWEVFSPLYMDTLNFTYGCFAGNIGDRRPQLRLTKGIKLGNDARLQLEGAIARTIGTNSPFNKVADAGEDAGFPSVQGRMSVSFPFLNSKKTTLGVSGHWAKEEYDIDNKDHNQDFDSWSANMDLTLPITDWLTLQSEAWIGKNVSTYGGGIGQGVNLTKMTEIASQGGWAALKIGPWGKCNFNLGAGMDNPEDDDLSSGGRTKNRLVFGNVLYNINEAAQVGLELAHMKTDYKDLEDGDNFRAQAALIYNF